MLRIAGQELTFGGEDGKLPRTAERRVRVRLEACARRDGNVHGQVVVRVGVGDDSEIDSIAFEPAQDALDPCMRALVGQRVAARAGSYRVTAQLP